VVASSQLENQPLKLATASRRSTDLLGISRPSNPDSGQPDTVSATGLLGIFIRKYRLTRHIHTGLLGQLTLILTHFGTEPVPAYSAFVRLDTGLLGTFSTGLLGILVPAYSAVIRSWYRLTRHIESENTGLLGILVPAYSAYWVRKYRSTRHKNRKNGVFIGPHSDSLVVVQQVVKTNL
jgi:hypothetical protein